MNLKVLILVNCNLDQFSPTGLGKIEKINLQGNMITNLNQIVFNKDSSGDTIQTRNAINDCQLKTFYMADNKLETFPFYALHKMDTLKKIDLGRNNIRVLLDDQERSLLTKIQSSNKSRLKKQPFIVFEKLKVLDLSSNQLQVFPEELNSLVSLRELNLINNKIEIVPSSFFMNRGKLKKLYLNQNPLRELDQKIDLLSKLKVLGIAATRITKLPPQIAKLKDLVEIYVSDTPLKQPKLALAERGMEAIKEFFRQNEDENEEDAEEDMARR